MPERTLEDNVRYIVGKVRESPGKYDLRELFHVSQEDELSWVGVGLAIGVAIQRGLIEAQDDGRVKRNYYPVCNGCPRHG